MAGNTGIGALSAFGTALGGSAGSGLMDAIFGGISARRQWKYAQKQMKLQQQYALEQMAKSAEYQLTHDKAMFDYENDYNDPSKVFERYARAGINPSAVLGSSGVGMSSTVPTGSGGSPSASGPSAAAIGGNRLAMSVGDPLAASQIELARSSAQRNAAAADRDSAEAERIKNTTPSSDAFKEQYELQTAALRAGVSQASELADLYSFQAKMAQARSQYADLIATQEYQTIVADYAALVEEYRRIRAANDAEIPYLGQLAAANLAYTLASASEARYGAAASELSYKDMLNWFEVNWETPIEVEDVDEKGKPTGKKIKLTGKEIQSLLLSLTATEGKQGVAANWFEIRNRKNALAYNILERVTGSVAFAASARASRGKAQGGRSVRRFETYNDGRGYRSGYEEFESIPMKF